MKGLLLDTVVFLRLAGDPGAVPKRLKDAIDGAALVYLSAASVWEIALKASIGKLSLPEPAGQWIASRRQQLNISELAITSEHAAAVESLPFHHRDPFDRLLIAQAIHEGLAFATVDQKLHRYPVRAL